MPSHRLTVVQHHLDNIDVGWSIATPQTVADPDVLVLENHQGKKLAYAVLPQDWFDRGMESYIEWEIRRVVNDTKVKRRGRAPQAG